MTAPARSTRRIASSVRLSIGAIAITIGLIGALSPAAALAASPVWSPLAASGPTNLPPTQSETQRVGVDAEGGSFTLTATTAEGSGTLASGSNGVTAVSASLGAFQVGDKITGEGIPAGTTVTAVGAGTLTLSANATTSGSKALLATETTTAVNYNIEPNGGVGPSASLQNALVALPGIGAGGVSVVGGPGSNGGGSPYLVTFGGSFANKNVAEMSANSASLTGGGTHTAVVSTTVPGGPGTTELVIYAQDIGGSESFGAVTIQVTLPPGITTTQTPHVVGGSAGSYWNCTPTGAGQTAFTCTTTESAFPGLSLKSIVAQVTSGPGAISGEPVKVTVSGGGATGVGKYEMPLTISAIPSLAGIQSFVAGAYDENGVRDTRAGAHPYSASTGILVNTVRNARGIVVPVGDPKDIMVELPPGFLGNPIAVPQCPTFITPVDFCPTNTTVGLTEPILDSLAGGGLTSASSVKNIQAPYGYPAKVEFDAANFGVVFISVIGELRSDKDYGVNFGSPNTPEIAPVFGAFFGFWGSPSDPSHDTQRCAIPSSHIGCVPAGVEPVAFATNATDCSAEAVKPAITTLNLNTWQDPLHIFSQSITLPPVTECNKLKFESNFTFEPSGTTSDSPASFTTSLSVPAEGLTNPTKLTTPEIKENVVKLPAGVVLSPAAADGLQACSEKQIGLLGSNFEAPNPMHFSKEPNECPDASKIGTGELKSALLEDTLHGGLYLAAQGKGNPFGSLFAVYLVIEDPRNGIFIKLPGEVEPNKQTGQFQVTFPNLPQLPFTSLKLNLKGGNRAALASPTTCGNYVTTAVDTPWSAPESGPPTESANGFEINQGPNGLPCAKTPAERPFDIGWKAGADSVTAGASSPFTFQITRPDGSQEIETLDLTTPPGLSASLKGVPYCTEAQIKQVEARTGKQELANPACPAASQVGRLEVGAGSGPTPFYTPGKLYLAGPYKGAPVSVVSITPAVAGPFDLGNVVSRNALFINRQTAQVTAKSDPIPQILEGVPLRIRDIRVFLNHKDWTLNPTSCEPSSVGLAIHGNSGASKNLSTRFQVGGCDKLNFAPKLTAKVTGGTKRGDHPAFTAELNYPPGAGYANIKDVQVALPHSEFLDQSHINTICTRVQALAHQCPQGSIYGYAEATTPLLDGKLTGPVFLKSSDHQLPDLAIALKGPESQPVEVEFQGRIDSVHAQIRNTIEGLPDVPVTKFVLKMKGGHKGLLVNSRNLCQGKPGRMTVNMTAQNNKTADSRPVLGNSCGKAKKHKKAKKHQKRHQLSRLISGW